MKWLLIAALIAHPNHGHHKHPKPHHRESQFCGNGIVLPGGHVVMDVMIPCRDSEYERAGWVS